MTAFMYVEPENYDVVNPSVSGCRKCSRFHITLISIRNSHCHEWSTVRILDVGGAQQSNRAFQLYTLTAGPAPSPSPLLLLAERKVSCCAKDARAAPRISRSRWQPPCVGATRWDDHTLSFTAAPEFSADNLTKGIATHGFVSRPVASGYAVRILYCVFTRRRARDVRWKRPCCSRLTAGFTMFSPTCQSLTLIFRFTLLARTVLVCGSLKLWTFGWKASLLYWHM